VMLTNDNVPIIINDDTVNRTTNGKGLVNKLNLDQIKQLDAGSWFSPSYKGVKIPTLQELLEWHKKRNGTLILRIKATHKLDKITEIINLYINQSLVISSFNVATLSQIKCDELPKCLIVDQWFDNIPMISKLLGVYQVNLNIRCLKPDIIETLHQHSFKVGVYNTDKIKSNKLKSLGVDMVFTNT